MAKNNIMSGIAGLAEHHDGKEHDGAKHEKGHHEKDGKGKKKPKVVNLGKAGSFTIKHPGGLHAATHTPAGEKIPESKIEAAEHSRNAHVRHMAASAEGLKAMHHGKK